MLELDSVLQNTKNEANWLLPLGIQRQTGFQLTRALTRTHTAGTLPPDPNYRLVHRARHVCPGADWIFKPTLAKLAGWLHQQWRN